jgi:signal transduction histidine kinase
MTMGGILTVSTSTNVHEHKESEIPTCRLTIRDTGPGLSSSLPQNADHPFRSTEGQLSSGEVSIFTASRLARKYGGRIGLRNASDHGASVSLVLPAMKGQQQ